MATVHLLVGLNASGKTTHAERLQEQEPAVRFTLDEWVLRLFGTAYDHPGYPEQAQRCQDLIWDLACQVLAAGTDVVLDWNQWSRKRRDHWRDRADAQGHAVVVHYLPVPVETAIARAAQRESGGRHHDLDAAAVRHLALLLEVPTEDEGSELRISR